MSNISLEDWNGILPIISVPFTNEETIDKESFKHTIKYIDEKDVLGMVLYGIASEFYKISDIEKETLTHLFLNTPTIHKKIVSVTAHATHLAVSHAVEYEKMGADGIMLLPPFFLTPEKDAIINHIKAVGHAVSIPIIVQIAPGETEVSYSKVELLDIHKEFSHIIFKIEGSPAPIALISGLIQSSPEIKIFNGYAGLYMIEMLDAGCKGIMPGCSFSELYIKIYELYVKDRKEAISLHEKLCKYINNWMSSCEYIIKIEKNILMKKGIIASDMCRMPSYELQHQDIEDIEFFFKNLIINNKEELWED